MTPVTPRPQDEILVIQKGKLVIQVTDEERRQFLQWVRDYSEARVLGPPGVRDCYYYLRDKPWSFIEPDYKTENPDGTKKQVLWGTWVVNTLITARKKWLAGDRGPDAFDPDLLDDDGDHDIRGWSFHDDVDDWAHSIPQLRLDPWEGQAVRALVLCEKLGLRSIVENACGRTRTDFLCTGGDASIRQKLNVGHWCRRVRDGGQEPVVLYAGDHDMQGVGMDARWVRDVAEVDSVTRVAITLEQARERNLPMESAYDKMHTGRSLSAQQKGQNSKIQEYIDRYGPDMVELNALTATNEIALRDIIRAAIAEHIDADIWAERQDDIEEPMQRVSELIDQLQEEIE